MASYTKKYGKWQARFSYDYLGTRKFKSKNGFTTKAEAQAWVRKTLTESPTPKALVSASQSLYTYYMNWYEVFEEPKIALGTKGWYKNTARIIKLTFGNQPMTNITRTQYQKFLNDFGKTHSKNSSISVHSKIKMAVNSAMDDGVLTKDFTAHTHVTGYKGKDASKKYIDAANMWRLIEYCERSIDEDHVIEMMIITSLFTGFRLAETAGLQWTNLDEINHTLSVENTFDWTTGGFKPTKNAQSVRTVKVSSELIDVFHTLRKRQHLINNSKGLIFATNNLVKVPYSNTVNTRLKEILTELNITPAITFHGLRHTHASYLISQGVSIYAISERLGHANYTTTLNVYSHVQREFKAKESEKEVLAFENGARNVHGLKSRDCKRL